jgi:hypothetical protein
MNLWYIAYVLLTTVILYLALTQPALAASKVSQTAAASRMLHQTIISRLGYQFNRRATVTLTFDWHKIMILQTVHDEYGMVNNHAILNIG